MPDLITSPKVQEMGGLSLTARASRESTRRTLADWELTGSFPSLSVIVLNYRSEDVTVLCLQSVSASNYEGSIDIVLVDNGSTPQSLAKFKGLAASLACNVKLIASEENLGFAGGVLAAWPHANGDLVCLLNNDALVHPECFRNLVEGFRGRNQVGAVWPYDAPPAWHENLKTPCDSELAVLRNGTHSIIGSNIWLPLLKDYRQCFT